MNAMTSAFARMFRHSTQLHPPKFGQRALWIVLLLASYSHLCVLHVLLFEIIVDGELVIAPALEHVYPTAVPLVQPERYQSISLLSLLPFGISQAPALYFASLCVYFVCAGLWLLHVKTRWTAPLTALLYTLTMSLFWERSAILLEVWAVLNLVLIVFAAWHWFYGDAIARARRAGEFWTRPLFPQWVHDLSVFALAWFFSQAGWRKLAVSGWQWADGTSLQITVHWARARFGPSLVPAAQELVITGHRGVAEFLAGSTLVLESAALLGAVPILFPRLIALRWAYGLVMCGFMLGVFTLFGSWYFEALFALIVLFMLPVDRWLSGPQDANAAASFSRLFGPRRRAGAAPFRNSRCAGRSR